MSIIAGKRYRVNKEKFKIYLSPHPYPHNLLRDLDKCPSMVVSYKSKGKNK